jgi:hypothetical protein
MPGDRPVHILDLGPASHSNVSFWSQYRCVLYVDDFYRSFAAAVGTEESPVDTDALVEFSDDVRFDAILAWDIFNYLKREELGRLIGRLERWCRPESMIFALVSSQPLMPSWPMQFRILDREQISYQTCTNDVSPCPRHQPRDLARILSNFVASHSVLLRSGIQEYIFTYK